MDNDSTVEHNFKIDIFVYTFVKSILSLVLVVIIFFLGLRFILKLLVANPFSPFVAWVYDVSGNFVRPFRGIVTNTFSGGSILDLTALLAILAYVVLFSILIFLIDIVANRRRSSNL